MHADSELILIVTICRLIVLPFLGVLVDILAMWLKGFIFPVYFWLHIPGGGLFAIVFGYVSLRALWKNVGPSEINLIYRRNRRGPD